MPDDHAERTLILILGMGRSGTSAMAKMFELWGAHLPDNLLGPGDSNVKGHFEPVEALGINEAFLNSFGLTWFDPTFRIQHEAVAGSQARAFGERISKFLAQHADKTPLVIKEPRITALAQHWLAAAARADWSVKAVIPLRHPHDVRASLAARDGLPNALADALWTKYNLLAEHDTRSYPRVFVGYDRLLADPRAEMERAIDALGLRLRCDHDDAVGEFLDDALRHHATGTEVVPDNPWTAAVFEQLSELCTDGPVNLDDLSRLYELYVAAERTLAHAREEAKRLRSK